MPQSYDMLQDVEVEDPAVEAVLAALTVAQEMATLVRLETAMLEGETHQILMSNRTLMGTALSSLEAAQAAIVLARRWRL